MRVLVTGVGGLVGGALGTSLAARHEVHGTVRTRPGPPGVATHRIDLEAPGAMAALLEEVRPDCVVHAAYSVADLERDVVAATAEVAAACSARGVGLVHISTDAVFDGEHPTYAETDHPVPVHPYGRAKREAELAVRAADPAAAVVRTALVAHIDRRTPDSGTRWLLDSQARGERVTLFTDEIRTVVRLDDLVAALDAIVELEPADRSGCWHVGGPDRLSRWDLGRIVVGALELDPSLVDAGLASSLGVPRPRDVSLTCARLADELSLRPGPVATVPDHGQATR